jgi:hypothetical protein
MQISYLNLFGLRIVHTGIVNQEAIEYGLRKLLETCTRLGHDGVPVLRRALVKLTPGNLGGRSVSRRTSRYRILGRFWYLVEAKDLPMVFDGVADLLRRNLNLDTTTAEMLRTITNG